MANINVSKRLSNLRRDLSKLLNHVVEYSGLPSRDVQTIERDATDLATLAVQLASAARQYTGDPNPTRTILDNIRSAVD